MTTNATTVKHALDRREPVLEEYSPEWETKAAISSILDITLKPIPFQQQLKQIIDVVVDISWLGAEKKGAILIANSRQELVLAAHHGLATPLLTLCARVPFGRCLCGLAAQSREIVFKGCVDGDHHHAFNGMKPHGHYNIPLFGLKDEIIGVLVLYLEHGHKPHEEEKHFIEMLGQTVSAIILNRTLKTQAEISRILLQQAQQEMLQKLVAAAEYRDGETGLHLKRMSLYSVIIGKTIGLPPQELSLLEQAAPMHDIGKIGIPDSILLKPGKLTREEFATMKHHPTYGAKILSGSHPLIVASRLVALSHHEKWDGSGYPQGLKGESIPLFGRICALADVFDALTSKRPYKDAWPLDKALETIKASSGTHFDPKLVDAFFKALPEIVQVMSLYGEGRTGTGNRAPLIQQPVKEAFVTWDESLSVNIPHIDDQHKYLINLLNRLHNAAQTDDTSEVVETLLGMRSYAIVHFADEEEILREHGYPDLDSHIKKHRLFIKKTEGYLKELEVSPLAVVSDLLRYLNNWLINHIRHEDGDYANLFSREQAESIAV